MLLSILKHNNTEYQNLILLIQTDMLASLAFSGVSTPQFCPYPNLYFSEISTNWYFGHTYGQIVSGCGLY